MDTPGEGGEDAGTPTNSVRNGTKGGYLAFLIAIIVAIAIILKIDPYYCGCCLRVEKESSTIYLRLARLLIQTSRQEDPYLSAMHVVLLLDLTITKLFLR